MKVIAPCGHEVSLSDTVCPKCGASLTAWALFRHYRRSIRAWFSGPVHFACPYCRSAVPVSAVQCPHCHEDITPNTVMEREIDSQKARFERAAKRTSKRTRRRIQFVYLILSASLLWLLLSANERYFLENWVKHSLLSIVYLCTIFLLFAWLRPRPKSERKPLSSVVKLSLTLNYLAFVFLLQMWIATWWTRAIMLAGAVGVTWVGSYLFNATQPGFQGFLQKVFGEEPPQEPNRTFDHTKRQGRTANYD